VTEYLEEQHRLRALAFWLGDEYVEHYEYDVRGTPCEPVVREKRMVHIPDRIVDLYPGDNDLPNLGAVSYIGAPLLDVDGRVLGHLGVLDTKPMPEEPRLVSLFQIFAARAGAEHQRLRAEGEIRDREEKLRRLFGSAMDGIIELDGDHRIRLVNPAARKAFRCSPEQMMGKEFGEFLSEESREKFGSLIRKVDDSPEGERSLWVPGGLSAMDRRGEVFPMEATISSSAQGNRRFYTLILRDVNERIEAERKIRVLSMEAEYLREEIEALQAGSEIVGRSEALRQVLGEVDQVAETDSTVLLLGESGTGKELIARAIHQAGGRKDRPLVKVNCAAIPANLMESEFFGHEKGAFTGATQRREGRFSVADGGTILLDEVGDLPLDLQAKLLRVLQEGEFEPVGSSETRKVDVRVIAATNRDLARVVADKEFRTDLYYRLNVFPIRIPPLRERLEDVPLLAETFAKRFGERMGKGIGPLSREEIARLQGYDWPGNVRELENVIERAAITSRDGRLDLDRALPGESPKGRPILEATVEPEPIRTEEEFRALEKRNLVRALEKAEWKVSGDGGAAELLGMKPSTLSSRMKALGIKRPR
jgi:PAS domain S-box-containing protein